MSQSLEVSHHKGVVCLYCGKSTQLPPQGVNGRSTYHSESSHRVSIVRCQECGKEAIYLPEEVVDFQETRNASNLRARAAGLP